MNKFEIGQRVWLSKEGLYFVSPTQRRGIVTDFGEGWVYVKWAGNQKATPYHPDLIEPNPNPSTPGRRGKNNAGTPVVENA